MPYSIDKRSTTYDPTAFRRDYPKAAIEESHCRSFFDPSASQG